MNLLNKIDKEDQFGLLVTVAVHAVLAIFFLLFTFSMSRSFRPSYVNVQLGAFKTGTQTEFSRETHKQVQTSPNPSDVKPQNPEPKKPEPVEKQTATTDEITKPVDSPDQKQEIKDKKVKTPDTDKVNPRKQTTAKKKEQTIIPPKARQAETQKKGAETSGDPKGAEGAVDADQGTGNQKQKSAPYNLNIEGLNRDPVIQPLPDNEAAIEATIKLQFEVTPTGDVVNIIPLKKSGNPELDRRVIQILSRWQFSPLPPGVPQRNQTGTITFHFVAD